MNKCVMCNEAEADRVFKDCCEECYDKEQTYFDEEIGQEQLGPYLDAYDERTVAHVRRTYRMNVAFLEGYDESADKSEYDEEYVAARRHHNSLMKRYLDEVDAANQ